MFWRQKNKPVEQDASEPVEQKEVQWMRSPHAQATLGLISFSESVIAPIITDPFLVAIILVDRARWVRYTIITIISSVVGGVAAYFLGVLFFDLFGSWMLDTFQLHDLFARTTEQLIQSAFWFVFLGAITPVPYKLVALASGFVTTPLTIFIAASLLGRTLRFVITGYAAYAFGPLALQMFRYRVNVIAVILVLLAVAYFVWKVWG